MSHFGPRKKRSMSRPLVATTVLAAALNHPAGRHGFDILDDDARSREIVARTFDFLKAHLD